VFRNKCYALHNTHHVDDHLFYFPNFLFADINNNPHQTMTLILRWASYLGIIFAEKKGKWLESIAVVTGILVNLDNFTLSITKNRKDNILADLLSFFDEQSTSKHSLEVLVGSLTFVSKVAPAIRPLLSRLIHASTQATHSYLAAHPRVKWADVNSRFVTVLLSPLLQDDIRHLHSAFLSDWVVRDSQSQSLTATGIPRSGETVPAVTGDYRRRCLPDWVFGGVRFQVVPREVDPRGTRLCPTQENVEHALPRTPHPIYYSANVGSRMERKEHSLEL
jgi:hypothetical protein